MVVYFKNIFMKTIILTFNAAIVDVSGCFQA